MILLDARGRSTAALRDPADRGRIIRKLADWHQDPLAAEAIAAATTAGVGKASWGPPVYTRGRGRDVLNLRRPVDNGATFIGVIVAVIRIADLSSSSPASRPSSARTPSSCMAVIMSWRIGRWRTATTAAPDRPLPRLSEIGDPVLFDIWSEGWQQRRLEIALPATRTGYGEPRPVRHSSTQPLADYADARVAGRQLLRDEAIGHTGRSGYANAPRLGVIGLLLAGVVAFLVAADRAPADRRSLAQLPPGRSASSTSIDVPPLARSRLRELDEAASAFNAMVARLRAFAALCAAQLWC